jgi:hypothetical protein
MMRINLAVEQRRIYDLQKRILVKNATQHLLNLLVHAKCG